MAYLEQLAFADLCDDLQASRTEFALEASLTRFVRRNGFEWFAYIEKSPTDFYSSSSYPAAWQEIYIERNYIRTDPVLISASRSPLPLRWDGQSFASGRSQREFFGAASEFNVRNGLVIPIAGVYGSFVSLSLAGHDNDNASSSFAEHVPYLTLAGLHYHMQITRVREQLQHAGDPQQPLLTQRAKLCLTWIARGKTIPETAEILNVHEATVRYHLNEARRRLNASSLPHLVAEALQRREISYSPPSSS